MHVRLCVDAEVHNEHSPHLVQLILQGCVQKQPFHLLIHLVSQG